MRILIADDDPLATKVVLALVEEWGYEAISVENGAQASRILLGPDAPPIAILDWHMPGMTGPEVCRLVRRRPSATPPYLLLLTARRSREDVVLGLSAGADDYVAKPFDEAELRCRIHVGVRMVELRQALASRVVQLEEALAKVHTLQGLLPVCAWCRKVRNDSDYWDSFEAYLAEHTGATVTHGICPDCLAKVQAEMTVPGAARTS